jgi:hypothetical protein
VGFQEVSGLLDSWLESDVSTCSPIWSVRAGEKARSDREGEGVLRRVPWGLESGVPTLPWRLPLGQENLLL